MQRVVFHEVTKRAIQEAIEQPRDLSEQLVNAQQARRALDYLVGFNLSPLLWKKVRRGLSAGRVQSPALRLIVEREDEINAFRAQEYWTIEAVAEQSAQAFPARLAVYDGEKVEQFTFTGEAQVRTAEQTIRDTAHGVLTVAKVDKKQRRRNPAAPFTTSTLQQEASRKLGFSAQRTMTVAQRLYEGIDIGEGSVGLISYMRTDSVTLADEALVELRERDHRALRRRQPARGAAPLHDEGQERAGSARGDSADVGRAPSRGRAPLPRSEPIQALRAHLETHRRLADEPGRLRHRGARSRRGRAPDGRHLVPRHGLGAREPRLHRRVSGRPGRQRSPTSRTASCRPSPRAIA